MTDYGRYPEEERQRGQTGNRHGHTAEPEENGKKILYTAAGLIWEAAGRILEEKLEEKMEDVRIQVEKQTEMAAEQKKTLDSIAGWCLEEKEKLLAEKERCLTGVQEESRIREEELLRELESRENELEEQNRQMEELNRKTEKYKEELHCLTGESSGRDIYRDLLSRADSLPYCFRMDNYEAFIISVCAGGIGKFYGETMREKFMVGSSDEEKEELEYILDRCIELYNRIYPEERLRRPEERELIGEEYRQRKHEQKGGPYHGTIRSVILRGIISENDTVTQRSIVEVG